MSNLSISSFLYLGFEWVGWSNDSAGITGKPVELTFQFDSVRNFSAMVLHTNNMFSKGVQVSVMICNLISRLYCRTQRHFDTSKHKWRDINNVNRLKCIRKISSVNSSPPHHPSPLYKTRGFRHSAKSKPTLFINIVFHLLAHLKVRKRKRIKERRIRKSCKNNRKSDENHPQRVEEFEKGI